MRASPRGQHPARSSQRHLIMPLTSCFGRSSQKNVPGFRENRSNPSQGRPSDLGVRNSRMSHEGRACAYCCAGSQRNHFPIPLTALGGVTAAGRATASAHAQPGSGAWAGYGPLGAPTRLSGSPAPVGARNRVVAGQAACLYSLIRPSQRVVRTGRRGDGWLVVLLSGVVCRGGRWCSERCGR